MGFNSGCHAPQGALTLISFWPDAPPWPGQLDKLRIVAGLELATVTAFACVYALRVRRHIREAVPDAQTYLRTSVYTAPTVPLRCGALLLCHSALAWVVVCVSTSLPAGRLRFLAQAGLPRGVQLQLGRRPGRCTAALSSLPLQARRGRGGGAPGGGGALADATLPQPAARGAAAQPGARDVRPTCMHALFCLHAGLQTAASWPGCNALLLVCVEVGLPRSREEEGSGGGSGAAREDLEHRLAARERECAAPPELGTSCAVACDLPSAPSMACTGIPVRRKHSYASCYKQSSKQGAYRRCCGRLRALAAESDALQAQARAAWQSLDERSAAAHELEVWSVCCGACCRAA